jgi:exonuclease VII small subunit
MALDDELRIIQSRLTKLNEKRTRAEIELETAQTRLATARTALEEEFGVKTMAQAKEKLSELEQRLRDAVTEVETELEAAGA